MILTYGPDGVSGHPDHIAIGRFTTEAFHRALDVGALHAIAVPHSLAKTLGMTQIHTVPDEAITLTVDVSSVWEAKMTAIRCHRTNWENRSFCGLLPRNNIYSWERNIFNGYYSVPTYLSNQSNSTPKR